ncbi:MAG: hypothetical protein A3J75_03565 [Acidobacteria bacterium RBG_16_68_9]|nr:MAG: hypothetical protein A3J75_03565 [Acidobacteria bacterium RBG_16_68_9]
MEIFRSLRSIAAADNRERLLWAVRVRWLVIAGFFLLAAVARALGVLPSLVACAAAAGFGSILNWVNHWCVARWQLVRLATALAIPGDVMLITYVMMHTGGVHSPFTMMYVVQVVTTAMLVDLLVAAGSAAGSVVTLLGALLLEERGMIGAPAIGLIGADTSGYRLLWAGFLLYCLGLLVFLGGYVSERLRRSERDLAAKNERLRGALGSLEVAHADLASAYERLRVAEVQLVQSERLRALGQFVAGIAHELNNPIGFVAANVEYLRRHLLPIQHMLAAYTAAPIPPPDRDRLAEARRALRIDELLGDLPSLLGDCEEGARRTKQILDGLRAFARSDRCEVWERVDIHAALDRTLTLLRHRLGPRVTVDRCYGSLPLVDCLAGQLDQVFLNLLTNAADAVGDAGRIMIQTRFAREPDPELPLGPHVVVAICDSGNGIPSDVISHIFDPFFTTKPIGKGTGLGLSVSYGIVSRHGGTIGVESVPGAGSTFTVCLPAQLKAACGNGS